MNRHQVRKGEEIEFADGKSRTVYPLTIKALREFVKIQEKMAESKDIEAMSDDDIDLMVDASSIILMKVDTDLATNRDAIEDAVDVNIFGFLMSIAMGQADPEE